MKSPAIAEPLKQLQRLEARARDHWEGETIEFDALKLIAEEQKKLQLKDIKAALEANEDAR